MDAPRHYPPPDFSCPPPSSFQQQQPRQSSFHPGMWSWTETPVEPSGWYHGTANSYQAANSHQSHRGNHGQPRHYGQGGGWHQGGRPNYGNKQKNKKQVEFSYFCDTCDRGFTFQEKYDEHVSQHVKCSVPDCSFMAHEKVVSMHWKNNHAAGAKRIKLDTPEEIEKWREERRRNYPTIHNIEKKKLIMEKREETGSVLETAQFGRMRGRGRGRGRGRYNRGPQMRPPQNLYPSDHGTVCSPKPFTKPYREEDPLGILASNDLNSDKEDLTADASTNALIVPPKKMSSALGSLLSNYGSMSESEEEPEASPIKGAKLLLQENQSIPPTAGDRQTSREGDPSSQRLHPNQTECGDHRQNNRKGKWRRRGRGGRHQDAPQKRQPSLLERLLAPDIRHERNVLLQCVRYVVRNHFFGLESKPQQQGDRTLLAGNHEDKLEAADETMFRSRSFCDKEKSSAKDQSGSGTADGVKGKADTAQTEGRFIQSHDEIKDFLHQDSTTPDKTLSASSMYDDDIWESPDADF